LLQGLNVHVQIEVVDQLVDEGLHVRLLVTLHQSLEQDQGLDLQLVERVLVREESIVIKVAPEQLILYFEVFLALEVQVEYLVRYFFALVALLELVSIQILKHG